MKGGRRLHRSRRIRRYKKARFEATEEVIKARYNKPDAVDPNRLLDRRGSEIALSQHARARAWRAQMRTMPFRIA